MKTIKKPFRIPTLLALTLLAIALGLGIFIDYYQDKINDQLRTIYSPKKLSLANISDSKAAITWQTDTKSTGEVLYGQTKNLDQKKSDIRDQITPQPRLSHFVELSNLAPNTTYYYQIKSQSELYPKQVLSFKTGPSLTMLESAEKPLRGSLLNSFLNPLDDALVFLEIAGASRLVTFTNPSGNFILPLKDLRTKDLQRNFNLNEVKEAQITILQGQQLSTYKISIPVKEQSLQSLILGQNLDLTDFQEIEVSSTSSAEIATTKVKYDLNNDGKINAVDLSIVSQSIGKKPVNKTADLNEDGQVNLKDLDLIRNEL